MLRNMLQPIFNWITREGRKSGFLRLGLVCFILLGMVFLSGRAFTNPTHYPWVLFSLAGLHYWIFPFAGFLVALILAGYYASELYDLPNLGWGMRYVLAVAFGIGLPVMRIQDGQRDIPEGQFNLLEQAGGPGFINVLPGNLVLLENLSGPSNVYPAGFHFVSRREIVKEIASLADQHGYMESTSATTKDGITVTVREIRYHYRLRPSRRRGETVPRNPADPYPYTMQAMRGYTYNRSVIIRERTPVLTPISVALDIFVDGVITDYIYEHQFDALVAPQPGIDPRREILRNFETPASRARLSDMGIELFWVDIGHFDVDERVWQARVGSWEASWVGTAEIAREDGQMRRQIYHRLARAQGRVDALKTMIESVNKVLEDAVESGDQVENLRKLILLYSAQTLEEMSETKNLPGESAPRYPKINDPQDPWRRD
jgi:hypothetical protein